MGERDEEAVDGQHIFIILIYSIPFCNNSDSNTAFSSLNIVLRKF
jgi:hypothetical protein